MKFFLSVLLGALIICAPAKATELKSLIISPLWPDAQKLSTASSGVVSTHFTLPQQYAEKLSGFIGSDISQDDLKIIQDTVYYAAYEAGYPFASIAFPKQDFDDGHLYLYMPIGNVRRIGLNGGIQTDESYLASFIRQKPLTSLDHQSLQADLDVLNATGQRAWVTKAPTGDPAWVDVSIEMREKNPWNGYVSYDNSGSENSGRYRLKTGVSYGNLWNKGHRVSYNFNADANLDKIRGHSVSYSGLLPWRHVVEAFASYNDSDSDLVSGGTIIDQNQKSESVGFNYKVPMRQYVPHIGGTFRAGAVFKNSEFSSTSQPGPQRPGSKTQIFNLIFGYSVPIATFFGDVYTDTSLTYSPGGIGGRNKDSAFALSRVGAEASYVYARSTLHHYAQLPYEFLLTSKLEGQLSDGNLLSSERLSAGGQFSVRGFQQGLVQGDNGGIWSFELAPPVWVRNFQTGIPRLNKLSLQPVMFYEGGHLETKNPSVSESSRSLQSAGIGLRLNMGDVFSLRYDYGHQLDDDGFDDGESGQHHFRLTASF